MDSILSNSLLDRAEEVTQRNLGSEPLPPPAVASQDPFIELVIRDIGASLPAELAQRIEAAPTVAEVYDWMAAGALYRWAVGCDPHAARAFLAEVGGNPKQAGLALAKAFAARMEPPPRDAQWRRSDRIGLFFQLVIACTVLVCRGLLFNLLGHYGDTSSLMAGETPDGLLAVIVFACAAVWLGLEATVVPRLMERARQWPARRKRLPPPLAWRTDTFYLFWLVQAAISLVYVGVRCWENLARSQLQVHCLEVSRQQPSPSG